MRPDSWEEVLEGVELDSWEPERELYDDFALVKHILNMGGDPGEECETVVRDPESQLRRLWPESSR